MTRRSFFATIPVLGAALALLRTEPSAEVNDLWMRMDGGPWVRVSANEFEAVGWARRNGRKGRDALWTYRLTQGKR